MTRRRMLLLIIGSLITVSTAVGVGVNFATANGSSQTSLIKGIDTSSPITKDSEETKVIDKEEDKSPSTPPAKVEINDKRKVSQTQTKDKQEPAKQTTPPTNSPVVIRKEGGTSNTNNKGTQLIIGDASKLNLPQKEDKDSQSRPAVVIIKDTPTPPQTKEVQKNEEQSNSGEQKPTSALVGVVGKPQPQKTLPQQKEESANKESSQQQSQGEVSQQKDTKVSVQAPSQQQSQDVAKKQETEEATPSDNAESHPDTTDSTQVELIDKGTQQQNKESIDTKPTLTESQTKILKAIDDFKNIKDSDGLNKFMETHIIRPDEADLFFANIPTEWIRDPKKQGDLRSFWVQNWWKVADENAKLALTNPAYRQGEQYTESPNNEFNRKLNLAETGQLNGKRIFLANSGTINGGSGHP